ncbi:DUF4238 domain-containing protein [Tardiphaga robiniae]|uniref:DUF4238 domain-containing protein n=1 Tax=Tardiphaga robiniae TaxID=943830 RepID=UPI0015860EF1|nr:DUF4238 domain-containing protein [Tardiphaga robiniae]
MANQSGGTEPRKHHYVPQFYLRNFVDAKGMLLVADRGKKKVFRSKPPGVANERDFNRIEADGLDANAVEKLLSEFEGEIAPHLKNVIATKSLADEKDRAAMVNLMAALSLRNPKRRAELSRAMENGARRLLGSRDRYEQYVANMKKAGKWNGDAAFTLGELEVALAETNLKPAHEALVAAEIDHHDHVADQLWQRKWVVVEAAPDSSGFITTDDPVAICWTDAGQHAGDRPGMTEADSEIIFPLSPRLALRGRFDFEADTFEKAGPETVGAMNTHMINHADKQVYSDTHAFKYAVVEGNALKSGAVLVQDEQFLRKRGGGDKIVALKVK